MSQNPNEKPEPPAFPAVNRQPMTRREARLAREAQEAQPAETPGEGQAAQEEPRELQEPEEHREQPTEAAPPPRSARAAAEAEHPPLLQSGPVPAVPETSTDRDALDRLDFDAVITGPIAQVEQPEPVGAAARRHGSDARDHDHDHPARALFGAFADHDETPEEGGSPLAWRQQNYLSHEDPPKRKRRWVRPLIVFVVIFAVLGGMAGAAYAVFQPQVAALVDKFAPKDDDYSGSGTGEVMFTIVSGDTGSDIATKLHKAGVTKSYDAFYSLLLRQSTQVEFQPGVFKLAKQMSASSALVALQDPASRVQNTAVIPEGTAAVDALQIVSEQAGISLDELKAAAAKPADFGLPAEAKSLEGFLFPATYTFGPGTTAHDAIKTMVDRMFQALDEAGVAPADRWKTIILASVVQREAGLKDDYPKVARVFLNRLAQGWKLQSDATVAYGTGNTHRVETTDAERADASNPYNTYAHEGLPVGPISNPGDLAINAVVHPADGPWMFFVTWNLETGETIFSTTDAEHEAAVEKWQQWMKDHPEYE
ncbi:endolytic transglycosylase MltG [Leifsonia sp. F6_8S_P_1B]|uniref:Endolytic murein transglycosylase n=1 Tax=Leifsonia williamsii TaxID=3035919 RepID=A0ABT8KEQ5_9MICO|nr:endolytic transglycosylase MltG [Leifsonia williamsii]MDN4615478.1 endolytic transglycosylase MltG [Leifsonia williamsii]